MELSVEMTMNSHQDPMTLFKLISAVQNRLNSDTWEIIEEQLIAIILNAAPNDYQEVLTIEQRVQEYMLIIADLESIIYHHWRQFKVGKEEEKTTN